MSSTLTPAGFAAAPVVPQASGAGQIVGLNLQNTSSTVLAAQPTTFGETFMAGAVKSTDHLTATINGQVYAVQMDAKTFNPDGSVAMAVLTVDAPALPANSTTGVMLSVGGTPNAGLSAPAANLSSALRNYSLTATLDITANAGGATGTQTINIAQDVLSALNAGTATKWLNGPLAQEAIVSIPVSGSLRIEADVTAYANGTISANLQFNNDVAMSANGGTITYSTSIAHNGVTIATQPSLTQYQYQDWSTTVGTAPAAGALNIQHDVAYLEATGAVQNYDTQYGVSSSLIAGGNNNEASQIAAPGWNAPLGVDGITQYMPGVGGRGDIGPTTSYNATWLITQNATAKTYALGQAQEAGSVPWHFYDPSSGGAFLTTGTPGQVNVWTDPRGRPGLTQSVSGNTGWKTDQAHMPDLSYAAYIQTGNVQYLEQLNAQASFAEVNQYTPSRQVTTPQGTSYTDIIVNGEQIRGAAWSLRAIQEAAYANPATSTDGQYFTQATNDNYAYLNAMIPTWTQQEGQAHGYVPGAYGGSGEMAPWQQDYFASTVIQGAEFGMTGALNFLKWESNYLVGRFFAETQGFSPLDAFTYNVQISTPNGSQSSNTFYSTWSQIEQGTMAYGQSNVVGNGSLQSTTWAHAQGDYGALALQTLAGIITVSTSSTANAATMGSYQYQAMQAFGWLLASGAPFISPYLTAGSTPQFSIDPRLANGQLLSFGNVTISTDTTPTLLTPVDPTKNALLYAGSGADTLVGGTGINLMFGGSGADVIIGGPNGNDIFAGSGNETIEAGGGATFIQASSTALLTPGTGQDLFIINQQASGAVTISGFNPTLDRLDLVNATGAPLSAGAVASIMGSAATISGGVVLHVSSTETLTIETAGTPSISSAWFQEQAIPTVAGATGGSGSTTTTGGSVSTSGGGVTLAPPSPPPPTPAVTSVVGGAYATIPSVFNASFVDSISSAAVDASMTGRTETVTITGGYNTIDAIGGPGPKLYPTSGNIVMTGDNNALSVTGGSVTVSGSMDSVVVPYTFGSLSITLTGTGDTVSTSSFTSPALNIEGSGNVANFNSQSVIDTIGGSNNTVTAGTYSIIDVSGTNDRVALLGETRASVSGSGNTIDATNGWHSITATNTAGAPNLYEVGGSVRGAVTISGFNPTLDKIRVLDSSGNPLSQSAIDQIVSSSVTVSGSPNVVKLATGTTLLFLDLSSGAGNVGTSWFEQTTPTPIPAGPVTIDGGVVIQNGGSQTVLGANANVTDTVSGSAIDARRTYQQETVTLSGSADTVDAVGAAGSNNFTPTGNLVLNGNNDIVSVTAGTTTDTGNGNAINVPWQFGSGNVVELGTNATITAGANTAVPIDLEGSGNQATISAQTALQTIGGVNNTVTSGAYARLNISGTGDHASISGEVSATVSGSADTVTATGFNKVLVTGSANVISVPGGSWTAQDTVIGVADTVFAGGNLPGGDNKLFLSLGANSETVVTNGQEVSTISGGSGSLSFYAGGASNLIIGGTGTEAITASGGNTTLVGGTGSVDVFGNGGNVTIQNVGANISIHDGGSIMIDLTGNGNNVNIFGSGSNVPGKITINGYSSSDTIRYASVPGALFTSITGSMASGGGHTLTLSDGTSLTMV